MTCGIPKKVLIVDDDELVRDSCAAVLSYSGYCVETAPHGMEALVKLRGSVYSLVISDVNMPVLDGVGLYLAVEKEFPHLKDSFLLMSGNLPERAEARLALSGRNLALLKKPFMPQELLTRAEALIGRATVDRRREKRHAWTSACEVYPANLPGAQPISAQIRDISRGGLKIRHEGGPLRPDGRVSIHIMGEVIRREADVRWAASFEGASFAGLRVLAPLPVDAMLIKRAGA